MDWLVVVAPIALVICIAIFLRAFRRAHCPYCGKWVRVAQRYCPHCGEEIE